MISSPKKFVDCAFFLSALILLKLRAWCLIVRQELMKVLSNLRHRTSFIFLPRMDSFISFLPIGFARKSGHFEKRFKDHNFIKSYLSMLYSRVTLAYTIRIDLLYFCNLVSISKNVLFLHLWSGKNLLIFS